MKLDSQSVTTVTSSRCLTQRAYTELNKTGKCTHKVNIEVRSCKNCCSGKAISITYSERVSVALVIQHAWRFRERV